MQNCKKMAKIHFREKKLYFRNKSGYIYKKNNKSILRPVSMLCGIVTPVPSN